MFSFTVIAINKNLGVCRHTQGTGTLTTHNQGAMYSRLRNMAVIRRIF